MVEARCSPGLPPKGSGCHDGRASTTISGSVGEINENREDEGVKNPVEEVPASLPEELMRDRRSSSNRLEDGGLQQAVEQLGARTPSTCG